MKIINFIRKMASFSFSMDFQTAVGVQALLSARHIAQTVK